MKTKHTYILLIALALISCIRLPANPESFYTKRGLSTLENDKAYLECFFHKNKYKSGSRKATRAFIRLDRCMRKAGFTFYDKSYNPCNVRAHMQTIRECTQPLSMADDRSVKRRLNSRDCRRWPNRPRCQP